MAQSRAIKRKTGPKPLFSLEIELAIARMYLIDEVPGTKIAERFAPISRTGKLSESGVRKIANRRKGHFDH